ncbi:hypothetical protein [Deinococcus sp.]|uniref:hypothetical protein n=1 Tax=Deinococcus sp. TaxID=47478 RepID=UPI00345CF8DD
MNPIRYIITRSCLQEGSMRLLKYNESFFPENGPVQFIDDRGTEHTVQVERNRMCVSGLGAFYHAQNLGVNDVMVITPMTPGRYEVETIVKPHAAAPAPRQPVAKQPDAQRVVVSSTPHVREVRMQRPTVSEAVSESATPPVARSEHPERNEPRTEVAPRPEARPDVREAAREVAALFAPAASGAATQKGAGTGNQSEDLLAEFARLTGYQLTHPASGLMRLSADLGPQHGYTVLLAADPLAMTQPAWENGQDEAKLLLTHEAERAEGVSRVTREALVALTDHARLTPLSPIDLRGYWRAGNLDLAGAASIAELVSAHLAQRGAFSFVVLSLAQQPANSIISVMQLAQRLGSGVNTAELNIILETLSRPPFLALTPLQGGQYLLRMGMADLLSELSEYALGVRRRVRTPGQSELAY